MKKKLILLTTVIVSILLIVYIFKSVDPREGIILTGSTENWEGRMEVVNSEVNFYLNPSTSNKYSGKVAFSYKVNSSKVNIEGYLTEERKLYDKSYFDKKIDSLVTVEVEVRWDGKSDSFVMLSKNP
ncbi:hypothetical protein [Paenibacillus sp. FSL R7-0179]|uniref:hypothetical protein n=1 Tax=Paenibacillus sp. FSL R7-0179 TaxID=2921672 RepID=UPI0030F98035